MGKNHYIIHADRSINDSSKETESNGVGTDDDSMPYA